MMSDASDMLAAALEQMDGIIAGKSDMCFCFLFFIFYSCVIAKRKKNSLV